MGESKDDSTQAGLGPVTVEEFARQIGSAVVKALDPCRQMEPVGEAIDIATAAVLGELDLDSQFLTLGSEVLTPECNLAKITGFRAQVEYPIVRPDGGTDTVIEYWDVQVLRLVAPEPPQLPPEVTDNDVETDSG